MSQSPKVKSQIEKPEYELRLSLFYKYKIIHVIQGLSLSTASLVFISIPFLLQILTTTRLSRGPRAPRLSQCLWARPWTKSWWTCHLPPPSWSATVARILVLSATFSSRWPVLTHRFGLFSKILFSYEYFNVYKCLHTCIFRARTYMGCSVMISKL